MKNIQFKVTLLSDIILNQKSASQGNQETLDFIPGSVFLGIVAAHYNDFSEQEQLTVFHSSSVKFGDAHPLFNNTRALRTPACFHTPKTQGNACYIHHQIPNFEDVKDLQLKQGRSDFYVFEVAQQEAIKISISKDFAIKSAYDREKRRAKDEQMYGYESIQEGFEFCFEINFEDGISDELIEKVKAKLIGKKRAGRSRTAQYGLIEIIEESFNNVSSDFDKQEPIVIYAESRLIFLDNNLNPKLIPEPKDFGIDGGKIDLEKSQIRTFAYSPYNYHRACFDAERKGIEKGSVIIITEGKFREKSEFVGAYQNEGFGKIIVQPIFFETDDLGISKYKFKDKYQNKIIADPKTHMLSSEDVQLIKFLLNLKNRNEAEKLVYKKVNDFVEKNKDKFKSEAFASQWGSIRSLAMQFTSKQDLERELFTKTTIRNREAIPDAYLTHGVAKDKWSERGRLDAFKEFFNSIDHEIIQFAIINLSAEMAKIYGRKKA